ncbi:cytochrome-c peroxidase [Nitrosomonas communis]|uniref:cytochrome-c peroxidase n=1 Tax=Nitrosomonas communis TaxID=44574 RepID=UPI0026ECDB82|nr:cytochrome c peroxidase [Nitrosomonas communis]MCO6428218.1 c-type cytochrome [Nitrosomonas communis]
MTNHSFTAKGKSTFWISVIAWVTVFLAVTAQAREAEVSLIENANQVFKPLPQNMATEVFPIIPIRVALGRKLFFDPRLSLDGTVSCATCHRPALYGTDALAKSIGVEHRLNARNAPTILNAALQFKAHWIGDRENVEEQAMRSLIGHSSFGNPDFAAVVHKIKALPGYEAKFKQAFPDDPEPVQPENWGKAIGAYERTLVTPSPFDAFLKGDVKALTSQAQNGLKNFMDIGCASCHNGVGVGGSSFQKFGVFEDYWKKTGSQPIDEGRFAVTKNPADKYIFKVPSLRNVAMTPPYFHDGSVAALPQAVRIMGKVQLDRELTDQEVYNLVAFLESLTGEQPEEFITEPILAPQAFSALPP